MVSPSKAQIQEFTHGVVWEAIQERVRKELERADYDIESPDPFQHGKAVGQRTAWRNFLKLPEVLVAEAEGKSPYGKKP